MTPIGIVPRRPTHEAEEFGECAEALDELFETLTLIQPRKVTRFPIVLYGSAYGGGLVDWLTNTLIAQGKATEADLALFQVTDDVDEAVTLVSKEGGC